MKTKIWKMLEGTCWWMIVSYMVRRLGSNQSSYSFLDRWNSLLYTSYLLESNNLCFNLLKFTIYVWYLFVFLAGEAHSLKVENILFQGKSEFQEILVFEVLHSELQILMLFEADLVSIFYLSVMFFFSFFYIS